MVYTDEQLEIINSQEDCLDIKAGPGTGKTTLAIGYAKLRPMNRILYVVYTDASKQHARKLFPNNTTVHSAHSLAYEHIGVAYSDKIVNSIKVTDIIENIEELSTLKDKEKAHEQAHTTLLILNSFLQSALVDFTDLGFSGDEVIWAEKIFSKMIDETSDMKITQDAVLKLFELMEVTLDYDTMIVDERQDMNPVTASFVSRFKGQVVLIGDTDQTIFGFRGSRGLIHGRKSKKLTLTHSFRFGDHVALTANILLQVYKQRKDYTLVGDGEDEFWNFTEDDKEKYTYIARTNSHIIEKSLELVKTGKKVYINGGFDNIIKDSLDAYYLYIGEYDNIKSKYMKGFKNYYSYKGLGKSTNDPEINYSVQLIEKFQLEFLRVIETIRASTLNHPQNADVILTSAHKSKGLEWDNVKIANDYPTIFNKIGTPLKTVEQEEINILFVAVTRARYKLDRNLELRQLFQFLESDNPVQLLK